jgi:hypothetical protein
MTNNDRQNTTEKMINSGREQAVRAQIVALVASKQFVLK